MARRVATVAAAALLTALFAAGVQAGRWSPFWDAVAERPDAKVTDGVNEKGEDTRIIELSSGVRYGLTRHGDKISSADGDVSGHGAVLCTWGIFIAVRAHIEACSPGEDPGLEADLDQAIDRINDFIAENSLVPTTKPQMTEVTAQRKREAKTAMSGPSPEDRRKRCGSDGAASIVQALKSRTHEALAADVTKLLSVKRPPVMNPCL